MNENKKLKHDYQLLQESQNESSNIMLNKFKESNEQMLQYINSIQEETQKLKEKNQKITIIENENNMLKSLTVKLQKQIQDYVQTRLGETLSPNSKSKRININSTESPDSYHITITQDNKLPSDFSYNTQTNEINQSSFITTEYRTDSIINSTVNTDDNQKLIRSNSIEDYGKIIDNLREHNNYLTNYINDLKKQDNPDNKILLEIENIQSKLTTYESTIQNLQDEIDKLQTENINLESDVFEHTFLV